MSYWVRMMSDESDQPSWFRHAASAALAFMGWVTYRAIKGAAVPDTVWEFWLPVTLMLLAGAGGPKMVMYLAQMGATLISKIRGSVTSSYREVEQTTVVDDDPVKELGEHSH